MSTPIKMQLNHSAVERLIGGDTEVELELRQAVVAEFAKKHLKALAGTPEIMAVLADIKAHLNSLADDAFRDYVLPKKDAWGRRELQPGVKEEIIKHCRPLLDDIVDNLVDEAVQRRRHAIDTRLASLADLDRLIDKKIEEKLNKRLSALIGER